MIMPAMRYYYCYHLFALVAVVRPSAAAARAAAPCTLSYDARIPQNATPATFTTSASPFNPKYVLGANQTWDQVIELPDGLPPSRFDKMAGTRAMAVKLTDQSVFLSGSEGSETALRRAELLVNRHDETVSGHKVWHMSFRTDTFRSLNYSHEYLLAFHEAQDFQADFWSLMVGAHLMPEPNDATRNNKTLRLQGYKWDKVVKVFWEAPFTDGVWHNFGIDLDFPNNKIGLFYSTDDNPLVMVVPPTYNNISGTPPTTLGETHFGLQKRPVGANLENFLFNGTQPSGIHEAIYLGGIFQDDASTGCVTL